MNLKQLFMLVAISSVCLTACDKGSSSSCDDGVQNGKETGIDCGGDCDPCVDPGWAVIATDPAGDADNNGLDANAISYQYDQVNDVVKFKIYTENLSSFSSGPAADFGFGLPHGTDGNDATAYHWTDENEVTPLHKFAYIYCDPGGTPPSAYSFNNWPNRIDILSTNATLCTDCIGIEVDVANNWMIYTIGRTNIITDTEMGGDSAVINLVSNVGHDVGWDDNITLTGTFTIVRFSNTGGTCSDSIQNGDETGIDCGGSCPNACPTCNDNIQNGDETGIDCGGANCPACPPTCTDGIQNGDETGVDCGGSCPGTCPTCNDNIQNGDETGIDCGGSICPACPSCSDGVQNGNETGTDCGGPDCPACPTCSDGIQNGNEMGIDCGGGCPACPTCPSSLTDIDGNMYNSVKIGNQCWMKENLNTTRYRDGSAIPTGFNDADWTNLTTDGAAIYDDYNPNNTIYGRLYNWYAYTDSRGLCPDGWRIPAKADWDELVDHLGGFDETASDMLKSTTLWDNTIGNGNNSTGFSALPAGFRHRYGSYMDLGIGASFWYAEEQTPTRAFAFTINAKIWGEFNAQLNAQKTHGNSCRCIKQGPIGAEYNYGEFLEHDCSEFGSIQVPSGGSTEIIFSNETDETLKIYWINFSGNLAVYHTLSPNDMVTQGTAVGHLWYITDINDECITIIRAVNAGVTETVWFRRP